MPFPANIQLSTLNGTNGFRLAGVEFFDTLGNSVSSAGDVNGDGFGDVIIGNSAADPNGLTSGASYVVFGKASGFASNVDLSALNGSDGFRLSGVAPDDYSGFSVSSAGDVNGDGFDDLIVGARLADGEVLVDAGASYVVFGTDQGFAANVELSSLDGSNGFKLSGASDNACAGTSVASAGDVNGDGFADLIIGARTDMNNEAFGASYVVFGKAGGFGPNIELSSLDGSNGFKLAGVEFGEFGVGGLLLSSASAGDVNGDGFDDLIIGAHGAHRAAPNVAPSGASYVVFGKAGGFGSSIDVSSLDGSNGFELVGVAAGDLTGISVSSAGDVNGDGFADVIVGAPSVDRGGGQVSAGASYVVFGKAGGFDASMNLADLDGSNGFRLRGPTRGDVVGTSVSSAGDVNGDGFDDVIVGARDDANANSAGASYVVFGKARPFAASIELRNLDGTDGFKVSGVDSGDLAGSSVSSAGDVNGDGFADLIVGAPRVFGGGASYVVFGRAPDGPVNYFGSDADQTMIGGAFHDVIRGGGGDDRLLGHGGNDRLYGDSGDDTLEGGEGDDLLNGGTGADAMDGGAGNDRFVVDSASDTVADSGGDDDAVIAGADWTLGAGVAVERVIADAGATGLQLTGNELVNILIGGDGGDTLRGEQGDDLLRGGDGADTLQGGEGRDILHGGAAADTFVFAALADSPANASRDVIRDFEVGTDVIDLAAIDAIAGGGDDAFALIGGAFSGTAGELRQFAHEGNTIVAGDVNGDSVADFQIRLDGAHTLTAGDFLL